jgi:hypothetical protein
MFFLSIDFEVCLGIRYAESFGAAITAIEIALDGLLDGSIRPSPGYHGEGL